MSRIPSQELISHATHPTTVEQWARDYVETIQIELKFTDVNIPTVWEKTTEPLRLSKPKRAKQLIELRKAYKKPGPNAIRNPEKRAMLLHSFLHHELQAAELMCWALLAFSEMDLSFKQGLLRLCKDEIRHMNLYRNYLRKIGYDYGSFPIRDWFWERISSAQTPLQFLAVMGLGFESGNLDHSMRFAEMFRTIGENELAEMQETIGHDEVSHVAFAVHWFKQLTQQDTVTFEMWSQCLPKPLSPMLMRGKHLNHSDRLRAGLEPQFLQDLEQWQPVASGS